MIEYHGPSRPKDVDKLANADIVVTTYNTLTVEFLKSKTSQHQMSPLQQISWYRVVLDEGTYVTLNSFLDMC